MVLLNAGATADGRSELAVSRGGSVKGGRAMGDAGALL